MANSDKFYMKYLEVHLASSCNLNCKGCSHYCPLVSDKAIHSAAALKRDMKTLRQKVEIRQLRLLGGEPLLNPEISTILDCSRAAFPSTDLRLVTNGILIPAMKADFWESLKANNISIDLTRYPTVGNADKIISIIRQHEIGLRVSDANYFSANLKIAKFRTKEENYSTCPRKNCILLVDGMIYPCANAVFVRHFNRSFNEAIPTHPGLDIYTMTKNELAYLTGTACDTCSHCDFENKFFFPNEVSAREKAEWLNPLPGTNAEGQPGHVQGLALNETARIAETQPNNAALEKLRAALSQIDWNAYLAQNPDVAQSGLNPVEHYLRFGHRENRKVSRK